MELFLAMFKYNSMLGLLSCICNDQLSCCGIFNTCRIIQIHVDYLVPDTVRQNLLHIWMDRGVVMTIVMKPSLTLIDTLMLIAKTLYM